MKIEKVNSKNFIEIISNEHAYILGLLWADGHVTFANNKSKTPIIKHSSKEEDNNTFKEILLSTGNWNSFITENVGSFSKRKRNICVNWTSNRNLGEFLIKNGYREKTKSPKKLINKLNNVQKEFWFRGFFDGDGSVSIKHKGHHSVTFTGHKNQDWGFIINLFNEIGIENYKHRIISSRMAFSSQIRITNKKDIQKFYNYLYNSEPNIGLKRKREKFMLL